MKEDWEEFPLWGEDNEPEGENEAETRRLGPMQALLAAELMHSYIHLLDTLDSVEPEDTVFLQLNLQEMLLVHCALTGLQVMNPCLDHVANNLLKKMADSSGVQKEGAWVERIDALKDAFKRGEDDGEAVQE